MSTATTCWVDCSAGIAGDMLLGALLDAGADPDRVRAAVRAVDPALDLELAHTSRHSINAVKVTVLDRATGRAADAPAGVGAPPEHGHGHGAGVGDQGHDAGPARHDHPDHDHPAHDHAHHDHHHHGHQDHDHQDSDHQDSVAHHSHRGWREVRRLLDAADLEPSVREAAHRVFAALARAEGHVHGMDPEEVGFHEVGALDAIGDIVGCAAALADLGVTELRASVVTVGSGEQTLGAHGRIPIPGPAVLHLAREASIPIIGGPVAMEMTTPTGAAMLAAWATGFGAMPAMVPGRTGVGAGTRDPEPLANVCRVVLGAAVTRVEGAKPPSTPLDGGSAGSVAEGSAVHANASHGQEVSVRTSSKLVLDANIDDLDPRLWPVVLQRLLDAGADDAWLTPILMKKGRPAHQLSVLCDPALRRALTRAVFTETSTLGIRMREVSRTALERRFVTVEVDGVEIAVKQGILDGQVVNSQPEFEDVAAAATALGRPVKDVLAAAVAVSQRTGAPADPPPDPGHAPPRHPTDAAN